MVIVRGRVHKSRRAGYRMGVADSAAASYVSAVGVPQGVAHRGADPFGHADADGVADHDIVSEGKIGS